MPIERDKSANSYDSPVKKFLRWAQLRNAAWFDPMPHASMEMNRPVKQVSNDNISFLFLIIALASVVCIFIIANT